MSIEETIHLRAQEFVNSHPGCELVLIERAMCIGAEEAAAHGKKFIAQQREELTNHRRRANSPQ